MGTFPEVEAMLAAAPEGAEQRERNTERKENILLATV
jgi:hypothetical protein